jgi:four helix bundle protein
MRSGYKDLIVWQKSIALVTEVYKLTEQFPPSEIYGLTSQMRRCVVSIPSNIAEGSKRNTKKRFQSVYCHLVRFRCGARNSISNM